MQRQAQVQQERRDDIEKNKITRRHARRCLSIVTIGSTLVSIMVFTSSSLMFTSNIAAFQNDYNANSIVKIQLNPHHQQQLPVNLARLHGPRRSRECRPLMTLEYTASATSASSSSKSNDEKNNNKNTDSENSYTPSTVIDMIAFSNKNKSRQKFGLKPLSMEEFLRIEQEIEKLAVIQAAAIREAKAELEIEKQRAQAAVSNNGPSIVEKVIGSVLLKNVDTCESNFDCESPQVCCDYIFTKKCCSGGSFIGQNDSYQQQQAQPRYALIPVYGGDNRPNQKRY